MHRAVYPQPRSHAARQVVRILKRSVATGTRSGATVEDGQRASQAALQLLARSIQNGHRRLALIRLVGAVRAGAPVKPEYWRYCESVAQGETDLHAILQAAKRQHAMRRSDIDAGVMQTPDIHSQSEGM